MKFVRTFALLAAVATALAPFAAAQAPDTTPPTLVRGEIDGRTVTLYFSEALDTNSKGGWFRVEIYGVHGSISTNSFTAKGEVTISGNVVTVGLGERTVQAQPGWPPSTSLLFSNKFFYISPTDRAEGLKDLAGNAVRLDHRMLDRPSTKIIALKNVTGMVPTVTGVAVSSQPVADDTYARGATIGVRLTFSKAVTVTGVPRVKLDFSTGAGDEKWADYASGSGTTTLEFAYTVAAGDASSAGAAVLANTLELNGGTIVSVSTTGENATLTHAGLAHDANHKVDGTSPTLSAAAVDGATLTLTFNETLGTAESLANGAFTVKKTPSGSGEQTVSLSGSPTISGAVVTLTLANAVLDTDTDVKVSYTKPTMGTGNRLRDEAGNEVASFPAQTVTNNTGPAQHPSAAVDDATGTIVTLTFDEPLATPSARQLLSLRETFLIQGARFQGAPVTDQSPNTVAVNGATVTLTLGTGVLAGHQAMVSYRPSPSLGAALEDTHGNEVAAFQRTVTRSAGERAVRPTLTRAVASGTKLTLYYDETLDTGSVPARGAYTVRAGTAAQTVSGVAVSASAVTLTLSASVAASAAVTVDYTAGTNPVQDTAGNDAANLSGESVTNLGPTSPGKPGLAAADPASVAHRTLTLAWTQPLDPAHVPDRSAFSMSWGYLPVESVAVRGNEVELGLKWPVFPCNRTGTVSYAKPTTNALRNVWGVQADGFSEQAVRNAHAQWCVDRFSGVSVSRSQMRLRFEGALTREAPPRAEDFRASGAGDGGGGASARSVRTPGGAPALAVEDAALSADGREVVLSLSRAPAEGERLTVRYVPPHSGGTGLWDVEGHQVAPFTGQAVAGGGPAVIGVAVVSEAGSDATYAAGEAVRVALTFGEAVEVDTTNGTPRLKLDLGGEGGAGERWAAYEGGSGTETLTFAWTAVAPDESAAGIAVLADTLALDGGTIRSAATQTDAALGHAGIAHDAGHRVDAAPPQLLRGAIDGATMTLTFSEALDPEATGGRFNMALQTSGTDTVGFTPTGGVAVAGAVVTVGMGEGMPRAKAGLLEQNRVKYSRRADGSDGPLRDLAGNPMKTPGLSRLHTQDGTVEERYVEIDLENVTGGAPAVTGVAVVSDAGEDDTYALGERIRVAVTFGTAVDVDTAGGTPALTIDMDPAEWGEKRAAYESGSGTDTLVFVHEVVEPNISTQGIAVLADTLALHGGTIKAAVTQADAALGHPGIDHDPAHKVDWRLAPVPVAVTGVEVVSDAGSDGAWAEGETVEAAVTFDAPVRVDTEGGAPTLALIADTRAANGGIRRAAYVSGTGTARLVFAYRVTEADGRVQAPVRVAASGLKLNGGTIVAAAAGAPASLGFGAAPGVTAVSVATQADGRFEAGESVEATLVFAEPVAVEGVPTVAVTFGDVERRAAYVRGSGGDRLTFAYTLAEGEVWQGAPGLAGDSLRLDGGSVSSAGGGLAAVLAHPEVEGAAATPPPSVAAVAVMSDAGSDATYGLGERIRVRVSFTGAVTVTGAPEIAIDMDPAEWGTKRAVYERGSGSPTLIFVHEVVEPNISTQGIAVLADTLDANGGAIVSTRTGADALLGHVALAHDPAHKVDWRMSPPASSSGPPSVSGVSVVSSPASGDTYLLGETIRIRATFSEAVTVTGTPTLSIDMDPAEWGEKQAAYASGSGTSSLIFAHTVVEPNLSRQGIAVLADTLTLSGGTIRTAGGTDAALGHTGLGHASGHKVDWRPALSVADARAREGADEAVEFEVSLSRAFTGAEHSVTVDYATSDGTATAGEDYTAASGTLTFAAGETTKTVSVPVLDDSHDEGHETFSLRLSNLVGARAGDLEATGTIENTDPMPRAWLARFGRTLAEQVVDAVGARLAARGGGGAQARIAGQELAAGGLDADESARLADQELARWLAGRPEQPRTMSGGELLAGSAFAVTSAAAQDGPSAALWGRGGWSRFEGREGSLSVEGEVTTALLGAEVDSGAWLGGVMLSHARGDGSYRAAAGAGTVASTLTAVHPYVGVDLSERLTAWAAGGLGLGGLTLTPEGAAALETDLSLVLAALGARGRLVEPTAGSGFSLAIETDAYWVRTGSAEASGLAEAQADATRIRLGLDGGYRLALAGGGTLEPTVAVGVRHDGGDAETGYGMDVGGGLAWSAPALGLSAQVAARGLLTAEFDGFRDLGLSGSLAWDSDPASDRGASLSVTQTVGAAATGGSRALLGRPTLAGLAATGDGLDSRRLELKFGYGFPAFGERLTATPEFGVALSDTAREFRLGWKLGLARSGTSSFDLGVEAIRTEPVNDSGPQHGIRLKLDARY